MDKRKTRTARMIETADQKAAFDRQVKQILSYKPFLAWILKTCVDKFSGVSIEEIEGCIEGKPSVAEMAVHQDEQIRGDNTADTSIDEGVVTYDIRFTALTADSVKPIELFINIEGQYREGSLKYPLMSRVVYYLSRMISAQYGKVFTKQNYGDIRKVYSIWIVSEPYARNRNSVKSFQFVPKDLYGHAAYDKRDYDKITAVLINLDRKKPGVKNQILRMLNVLLSGTMEAPEKEKILENEFNILMSEDVREEMRDMCNFSEGVYRDGVLTGQDIGKAQEVTSIVEYIAAANHISLSKACLMAGRTLKEYKAAKKLLEKSGELVEA